LFFRITAAQTEFDRQRDQPRVAHILHAAMTAMRIRTGLRGNATGLWTLPLLNSDIENHRGETRAGNLGLQRETPGIPGHLAGRDVLSRSPVESLPEHSRRLASSKRFRK
jgi:hypothetical protein